jgi:hypothetical protein
LSASVHCGHEAHLGVAPPEKASAEFGVECTSDVFGHHPGEHGKLAAPSRQQRCSGGSAMVGMPSDATLVEDGQDLGRSHCLVHLLGKFLERDLVEMTICVIKECHLLDPEDDRRSAKFADTDLAQ